MPPTLIVTLNNTATTPIIVSGTIDLSDYPSLIVEITAPLPDKSVIPIIQASDIVGNFSSSVDIRTTYERPSCSSVTGQLEQTDTSVSVLLYGY